MWSNLFIFQGQEREACGKVLGSGGEFALNAARLPWCSTFDAVITVRFCSLLLPRVLLCM